MSKDPSWMGGGVKDKKKGPAPVASPLPKLPHEPINFKVTSNGETIDCLFYPSASYFEKSARPKYCYVFGHGGADHQRAKWVKEVAHRIVGHGYNFATLDFRGNGESTGRTVGHYAEGLLLGEQGDTYSNHEEESHDFRALIKALTATDSSRPIPVPVTILAMGGHSKGGIAALFHARNYPQHTPNEIINASSLFFQQGDPNDPTFFRLGMWAEIKQKGQLSTSKYRHKGKLHDYYITAEDIDIRERMDIGELTSQVSRLKPKLHLAAITGGDDLIAPPKDMEHYKNYVPAGQVTIKVVEDVGHTFKGGHETEALAKYICDELDAAKARLEKSPKLQANL